MTRPRQDTRSRHKTRGRVRHDRPGTTGRATARCLGPPWDHTTWFLEPPWDHTTWCLGPPWDHWAGHSAVFGTALGPHHVVPGTALGPQQGQGGKAYTDGTRRLPEFSEISCHSTEFRAATTVGHLFGSMQQCGSWHKPAVALL